MKRLKIILLLFLLKGPVFSFGQEIRQEISVYFQTGSSMIDTFHNENAKQFSQLAALEKQFSQDTPYVITKVYFFGSASPEGSHEINTALSYKRLSALEQWVRSRIKFPDEVIVRQADNIPWHELILAVENSSLSHKKEILNILHATPEYTTYTNNSTIDRRVLRLQALDDGKAWHELSHLFFKQMRRASAVFLFQKQSPTGHLPIAVESSVPLLYVQDPVLPSKLSSIPRVTKSSVAEKESLNLYVKSNAIGWGMLISNLAVELDWGKHLSFSLPLYYSGVNYFTSRVKFRTFCVQPELRYWLRSGDGWFFGAHLGIAFYNFALSGDWRIQDKNGSHPCWGGGVSVGYRMPLCASDRWSLEYTLGAGIYDLQYDKFHNRPGGILHKSVHRTFFGIDRAAVSLAYRFTLNRKGGKR